MISVENGLREHELDCLKCHGIERLCERGGDCLQYTDILVYDELLEYRSGVRRAPMTLEDLKKAADELGYSVVKKRTPIPKLLPCKCGKARAEKWYGLSSATKNVLYKCPECGLKTDAYNTDRKARETWNKLVSE